MDDSVAEEGDGGHEERAGDEDEGESESLPSDDEHEDEGDEEQGGVTIIGLVQGQALTLVHTRGRCWVLLGGPCGGFTQVDCLTGRCAHIITCSTDLRGGLLKTGCSRPARAASMSRSHCSSSSFCTRSRPIVDKACE